MATIQLDIAGDQTKESVKAWAAKFKCTAKILIEDGPAGGNPLYQFRGSVKNVQALYRDLTGE